MEEEDVDGRRSLGINLVFSLSLRHELPPGAFTVIVIVLACAPPLREEDEESFLSFREYKKELTFNLLVHNQL